MVNEVDLAATLLTAKVLWPFVGIDRLDAAGVKDWILTNTDRDHFFVPAAEAGMLSALETYVRGRLGPVFEGGGTGTVPYRQRLRG